MTETPARKPRPRRTFSAFGDVRRMPSEYEIVTHAQNWTLRQNRAATFEQNPSSAPNLWFLTYRDNTPLKAADWDAFRDPDALTYKAYVNLQADAETRVRGVLEAHAEDGADANLDPAAVTLLGRLFTPSRYLCHGFQQVEAYIGYMAPSSYITNAAAFATADFLRRVTTIAYRTRELQIAWPDSGIGSAERSVWEGHEGWQPARKAVEYALVSYDFGEAFTALNLVLGPTLDDVLLTQLGRAAKGRGDDLTWLLTSFLAEDSRRRGRWSRALADLAVAQRPDNRDVLAKWVGRWAARADEAALGLGTILEAAAPRPMIQPPSRRSAPRRDPALTSAPPETPGAHSSAPVGWRLLRGTPGRCRARPGPTAGACAAPGSRAPATGKPATSPNGGRCAPSCGGAPDGCARRRRSRSGGASGAPAPAHRRVLPNPTSAPGRTAAGASG